VTKATGWIVGLGFAYAGSLGSALANPQGSTSLQAKPATVSGVECARIAQVRPPVAAEQRSELGREFKLRNGEAAQVGNEGLALRFERVTKDGRCPVGDPCVSDLGDAVVLVTVQQQPHEPATLELHTHPSSTAEGLYLRYRVRMVRLEPRPVGEQYVPLPQYWATFMVSR
jgi:hypothetical protein